MNALQIEGVVAPKKPIVGTLPCCCAHAGYGLTTGASAALHSNATNARRRKPLVGAVRSLGATNWVSQPRTPSSLRAAFGRRPSRVGRLFEHLARRHRITFARPRIPLGMGMPSAVAVFWFPTQNLVHEIGRAVKHRPEVRSVEHQPSRLDVSLEMHAWSAASRSAPKY